MMTKAQQRRASEYQAKEALSQQLRKWAIQRGMTPAERYALGPTDTWHPVGEYYKEVLPLWCPLSMAWNKAASLPPASSFFTLVRGGIVETAYVSIRDVWNGTNQQLYVKDSAKTRSILQRLQSYPIRTWAWDFIKTRLVQDTFQEGWLILFKQVDALRRKLDKADWPERLEGRTLNLQPYIKVGELIDAGKMPPDLLVVALSLLTVWLQDYLLTKHSSQGFIVLKEGGKQRPIVIVHGHQQLVEHQKKQLVEFYRSNLDAAPASFRRPKTNEI